MMRCCPACGRELEAMAIRCPCGHALPEAQDARTDPERPRCEVCGAGIGLMDERCAACGADGYPALRPRTGRKWQGSPTHRPFSPPSTPPASP